jgi:hypothetical protein
VRNESGAKALKGFLDADAELIEGATSIVSVI